VSSDEALALTLAVMGGVVVLATITTTHRLWVSSLFETPQKIAQTLLLWLVPGSVIVVAFFLRETRGGRGRRPESSQETTSGVAAWAILAGVVDPAGDYGDGGGHGSHGGGDHGAHGGGDSGGHDGGGGGHDGGGGSGGH